MFPELLAEVAQAVGLPDGTPLPGSLRRAIAYLRHQKKKKKINNPDGYLYEAIISGQELAVPQSSSILPCGFYEWFNQGKAQGLVLAANGDDRWHSSHTAFSEGLGTNYTTYAGKDFGS